MVKRGYRLLILNQQGGAVRELHLSRLGLWAIGLGFSSAAALVAVAAWTVAQAHLLPNASRLGPAPTLHQGPAQRLALGLQRSLAAVPKATRACPSGMLLVEGDYCPKAFHRCLAHTDPEGSALRGVRCAKYEEPARCLSPQKKPLRYCIDAREFVAPHEVLPQNLRTFAQARQVCVQLGKRLCTESEWTFACEGEKMQPYPYGFARDSAACNSDQNDLVTPEGELKDLRAKPEAFPRCQSAFGVRDLTGNLEEYVTQDNGQDRPARMGGYWQPGANHCRASQPEPDPSYRGIEVGFRCCAAAAPAGSAGQ
jgi:sulfatase modifying factor 1